MKLAKYGNTSFMGGSIFLLVSFFFLLLVVNESHSQCASFPTVIFNSTVGTSKSQVYRVGVSSSMGQSAAPVNLMLSMAATMINSDPNILPDVRLELYMSELKYLDANALQAVESHVQNYRVNALLAASSDSETKIAQLVSRINKIPQVTAFSGSYSLSNKNEYPYLARATSNDRLYAQSAVAFVNKYGWRQVLVVAADDATSVTSLDQFSVAAKKVNITVYVMQVQQGSTNFTHYIATMKDFIESNRIRVFVHFMNFVVAEGLWRAMDAENITRNSMYLHIAGPSITGYFNYFGVQTYPFAEGVVGFIARGPRGPVYDDILKVWDTYNTTVGWVKNLRMSWYHYDGLLTIVHALDSLLQQYPLSTITNNVTLFMEAIRNVKFEGVTGTISFDENIDRYNDVDFYNYKFGDNINTIFPAMVYSSLNNTFSQSPTLRYYGNITTILDGVCPCIYGTCNNLDVCVCNPGYVGVTCNEKSSKIFDTTAMVLVIVIPFVVISAVIGGAVKYARSRKSKAIKDVADKQRSVISREDICLNEAIGRGASGVVYKGMFRGTEVAVKRLLTSNVAKDTIQEFELESAVMAGLRHPNIVLFMGSCFVAETKEMLLVMEFMEKGSLHDVIYNTQLNLTPELAWHIAMQAAKGMNFLHQSSPPIIHRDLKSHNILLDEKWNARISDFGITMFKTAKPSSGKYEDPQASTIGTIFWTAPEVFEGYPNTEKSDCYAFGIILWELVHRTIPYGGRDPMAVALEVSRKGLRPTIGKHVDLDWLELMQSCWAQDPSARPSFQQVLQSLRSMSTKYSKMSLLTGDTHSEAPTGVVYLVQTDIIGGNALWDKSPKVMRNAIELYSSVVRAALNIYEGYEAEFEGNGFLLVFEDLATALNFCATAHNNLLHAVWDDKLLGHPEAATIKSNSGFNIWRGLRVKMAVHFGNTNSMIDASTGKTKYFGPVVDKLKKLVQVAGMQSIVASAALVEQINQKGIVLPDQITCTAISEVADTSRSKMESVYSIVPKSLSARAQKSDAMQNSPHTVIDIEEYEVTSNPDIIPTFKNEPLSWLISFQAFTIKENVGKGAVADYYHGAWNGKEVAIKTLINQKLDEGDLLNLKTRVAELSKLKHKNLLEIYGTCLQPGYISLITEYMPYSALPDLLSNETITLNLSTKMKIAKQIAEGMSFVVSNEDPSISIHANLKSGNVLVNLDKLEVKLSDVGQGNLKDMARTMTSVGSVAWTAPEILSGDKITTSISVYSFGIILNEIYSRKQPYPSEHPIKLVAKVLDGHRPAIPADCPAVLKTLIEQCWSGEAMHRPKWTEIIDTLHKLC